MGCQGHASSAMLSRYRQTRRLLAAPFRAWPMRTLIRTTWTETRDYSTWTILTPFLARTSLQHCVSVTSDPILKPFRQTQIALALQTCATRPIWGERVKANISTKSTSFSLSTPLLFAHFCCSFFTISQSLERILTEHIGSSCSLES